ncbi:MFS transporter [Aestuariibacter halophilus]|uniref:MFS transporter n=1 Tax=Fluctibacter halophilus TaxID=226011 RepID=A0ABS8G9E8_9ALTE|nr:MFS transporter [Aestuariibacter halophilus]MCC2616746.1 MFS transporter [Aestuariibacter halophilus]
MAVTTAPRRWISTTYLFYYGILGVLVPYLGIFLDGRGFSSQQIGEIFALITLARILGPNLWAGLADSSGKGLSILRLGCALSLISFLGLYLVDGYWPITLCLGLMMMFWTAILPQLEVYTLNQVDSDPERYNRIRLWGSVGFIVLTITTGWVYDWLGSEAPVHVSVWVLSGLLVAALCLPAQPPSVSAAAGAEGGWRRALAIPFVVFIAATALLQMSFGPFYGFFSLYLRDLGYDGETTGYLLALGVVAEIVVFVFAGRLIAKGGIKACMAISVLLTALRWSMLAWYADIAVVLIISQLLHAFSFGLTHAASVAFIRHYFPRHFQSRGQALYVSLGFGAGGALGNYLAGVFWQQGSGATLAFTLAALAAGLSAVLIVCLPRRHWENE